MPGLDRNPSRTAPVTMLSALIAIVGLASCGPHVGMGASRGVRRVELDVSRPSFALVTIPTADASYELLVGVTEVTQAQYLELIGTAPSYARRCGECSVERVNFVEAARFANMLGAREGLPVCYELEDCVDAPPFRRRTSLGSAGSHPLGPRCETIRSVGVACAGYRLPTPDEFATFGRVETLSDRSVDPADYAVLWWFHQHGPDIVASRRPNEFGLYDTVGNVDEWLDGETTVEPRADDDRRLDPAPRWMQLAGTSYHTEPAGARSTERLAQLAAWGSEWVGFRVVRTAPR